VKNLVFGFTCLSLAALGATLGAQTQPAKPTPPAPTAAPPAPPPCSGPEFRQLDFWIGDWNLTHRARVARDKDQWEEGTATNSVRAILGGCVIEEHFEDKAQGFQGQSASMYNPDKKIWQQTWVDNQNSYLVFTGGMENGRMILSTPAMIGDHPGVKRMVFSNIKPDSFDWDWENTIDGGKTWVTMWKIHYARRK
jgi:Protein of unknown function (DUF1579)